MALQAITENLNIGMSTTAAPQSETKQNNRKITRNALKNLQINLGNLCNQTCSHCHVGASPSGKNIMDAETARKVVEKAASLEIETVELTGGAPEMNPHTPDIIRELATAGKNVAVRTNLTVLADPAYQQYLELYPRHNVKLIASLPAIDQQMTDMQRGDGVYETSIEVLQRLNALGYGRGGLKLDLVSNPPEGSLPLPQAQLESHFRVRLQQDHGIRFNNLAALANNPIKRHRQALQENGLLEGYLKLLEEKQNPGALENLMCRALLSVDYKGNVYDCDFSQAQGNPIPGYEEAKFWEIDFSRFSPDVVWYDYCAACAAAEGSSCYGSLDYKQNAQSYYGETLTQSADLVTSACCDPSAMPSYMKPILAAIEPEISEKYYGCESPLPHALDKTAILDLGCGTGRDIYIASKLAGPQGRCVGIDMTQNQIEVARKHLEVMTRRFGYHSPNVEFIHDEIESIENRFEPASFDIVISNCVMNLLEDKERVIRQVYSLLKPGGEFYFADIYSDRRLSEEIKNDPLLHGECLGGALYLNDFIRISKGAGFTDPRVMTKRELEIHDEAVLNAVANARFYSITYRLWKIEGLEDRCEDYGHVAVYKGGLMESPHAFTLDDSHVFYKNKPERVCGNTALMLSATRFRPWFDIMGTFDEHFGEFETCATPGSLGNQRAGNEASDCGC